MFEDAFVMRDRRELCALFERNGVLAPFHGSEARGAAAIGVAASDLWRTGQTYVGGGARVLQARRTGLIVGRAGIHVVRRHGDGAWRLAIAFLGPHANQPMVEET